MPGANTTALTNRPMAIISLHSTFGREEVTSETVIVED